MSRKVVLYKLNKPNNISFLTIICSQEGSSLRRLTSYHDNNNLEEIGIGVNYLTNFECREGREEKAILCTELLGSKLTRTQAFNCVCIRSSH